MSEGEWASVRNELHKVTQERDALAAKLLRLQEILRDHRDYDRFELIEELEGAIE
jgi:hypothetical protein